MARLLLVALVVLAGTILSPSGGSAQQTGVAAEIRQGNCDEVGEVVAPLVEARLPAGERRGNATAMPAANSFTTVPISLDALTASDHAIVVPFPVGDELVACGDIGGTLTEAGGLVIGLSDGDVGISGIAYLGPSTDPVQTNISLFITGEGLDTFLASTFLPPTVAEEDAARFAEVLAARNGSPSLAGPFAGELVQREGLRAVRGAGVATADFSVTATFVNPTEQTETPWEVGFGFHLNPGQSAIRELGVRSDGGWYYSDPSTGSIGAGPLSTFDSSPGATNTLDLVVEGTTALFGVNGELVIRMDLPLATASDVLVTSDYSSEKIVEGREIAFTGFEVWGLPGTVVPSTAAAEDDAALFAAALAARDAASRLAGPFGGRLSQSTTMLAASPAGIDAEAFSATATFVNPTDQPTAPWDYGLAFHLDPQASTVQEVYLDANGFWYYTDFPVGIQQSGAAPEFDHSPGGANTIDLIVDGATALLGVNGTFVARIELPTAMTADVMAATDFFAGNIVEGREIIYSAFQVWEAPDFAALPATPTAAAPDDAAQFAEAITARGDTPSSVGPFGGQLVQRESQRAQRGAGIITVDFSATVTLVNPTEQTETPWDAGLAFHLNPQASTFQWVYIDSDGFWYYTGYPNGIQQMGIVPDFDATPGGTNTLDLVAEGTTALVGVNGEFVARLDLSSPTPSDVYVTGSSAEHAGEGEQIGYRNFEVWS
jgi:hypothetical protein